MSYDDAMREAIASGSGRDTVLQVMELNHPGFTAPVRWVMIIGELNEDGENPIISLPISPGNWQDHVICFFSFIRPGAERDGPTEGRLRIDGVSSLAYNQLKQAVDYDAAISVTVREYVVGPGGISALTGPNSTVEDLEFSDVTLDGSSATGKLEYPDGSQLNVPTGPNAFFDDENYPTLYN